MQQDTPTDSFSKAYRMLLIGVRNKGQPKNRRTDEVINDLKKQMLRNWSQIVKSRKVWNDPVHKMYGAMWRCSVKRR